jgi:hypothetical protein
MLQSFSHTSKGALPVHSILQVPGMTLYECSRQSSSQCLLSKCLHNIPCKSHGPQIAKTNMKQRCCPAFEQSKERIDGMTDDKKALELLGAEQTTVLCKVGGLEVRYNLGFVGKKFGEECVVHIPECSALGRSVLGVEA